MVRSYGLYSLANWLSRWEEVNQMLKLFIAAQTRWMELRENEKGQAYVEYGILLAIVAVGLIVVLTAFSGKIGDAFNALANKVDGS
jgi:Flp pilus assembly pilin Flp